MSSEPRRPVSISINGSRVVVEEGLSVAAALLNAGVWSFRRSTLGGPRGPICAMGICYECRVSIDGVPHRRACTEICRDGIQVSTDG